MTADHLGAQGLHLEDVQPLAADVLLAHVDLALQAEQGGGRGVATPCWPAPVSAMMRGLPMRRVSRAWPMQLLILWAPVWLRSSRLRKMRRRRPLRRQAARRNTAATAGRRTASGSSRIAAGIPDHAWACWYCSVSCRRACIRVSGT